MKSKKMRVKGKKLVVGSLVQIITKIDVIRGRIIRFERDNMIVHMPSRIVRYGFLKQADVKVNYSTIVDVKTLLER